MMQWNLDQLRSFVSAAQKGSFSAAGRALGHSQSMISNHIAMLEADLGVTLFARSGRVPQLTGAGRILLDEAREILRQCERFESRAVAFGEVEEEEEFWLGLDEGLPYDVLTSVFQEMAQAFPHHRVRLIHGSSADVHDFVRTDQAHLGLAYSMPSLYAVDMEHLSLGTAPRVLAVSPSHELAERRVVSRSLLSAYRQIVVRPMFSGDPLMGISPLRWETNTSYSALDLAMMGIGWTIVPLPVPMFENPRLFPVFLTPEDFSLPVLQIVGLKKSGRRKSGLMEWLLGRLAERFGTMEDS